MDKILLETPEDEIDYQKVPLRDLILLAEHKERLMVCRLCIKLSFIYSLEPATTNGCKINCVQCKSEF